MPFRLHPPSQAAAPAVTAGASGLDAVVLQTDVVTIKALLLQPTQQQQPAAAAAPDAGTKDDTTSEPAAKRPCLREPDQPNLAAAAASTAAAGGGGVAPSVAYLCQLATIPGKFDPKKAAQLGVPRGPVSGWGWG
jgi:ribonuclease Z